MSSSSAKLTDNHILQQRPEYQLLAQHAHFEIAPIFGTGNNCVPIEGIWPWPRCPDLWSEGTKSQRASRSSCRQFYRGGCLFKEPFKGKPNRVFCRFSICTNCFCKHVQDNEYNLTVFVTDGTKQTEVESTIIVTDMDSSIQVASPIINLPSMFAISEVWTVHCLSVSHCRSFLTERFLCYCLLVLLLLERSRTQQETRRSASWSPRIDQTVTWPLHSNCG